MPTYTDYLQLLNAAEGAPLPDGWSVLVPPDTSASIEVVTAAHYSTATH